VTKSDGLTGANPAALAEQRRLAESLGGSYHQIVGDNVPEALLTFARAENATQLVLGVSRRNWLSALLTGPGVSNRTIRGSGDIDVHMVTHAQMGRGRGLPRARGGLPLRRRLAGYALAVVLAPVLTLFLASLRTPGQPDQRHALLPGRGDRGRPGRRVRHGRARGHRGLAAAQLLLHAAHPHVHDRRGQQRARAGHLRGGSGSWSVRWWTTPRGAPSRRPGPAPNPSCWSPPRGSVLRGQQALAAVLDRAREAFGMERSLSWSARPARPAARGSGLGGGRDLRRAGADPARGRGRGRAGQRQPQSRAARGGP